MHKRYVIFMAVPREKAASRRCIICEGALEKSNAGNICNPCKDKIRK